MCVLIGIASWQQSNAALLEESTPITHCSNPLNCYTLDTRPHANNSNLCPARSVVMDRVPVARNHTSTLSIASTLRRYLDVVQRIQRSKQCTVESWTGVVLASIHSTIVTLHNALTNGLPEWKSHTPLTKVSNLHLYVCNIYPWHLSKKLQLLTIQHASCKRDSSPVGFSPVGWRLTAGNIDPIAQRGSPSANPMTPQLMREPAWPVVLESSKPPLPRSSSSACTTMALPTTEWGPHSFIWASSKFTMALPSTPASTLPRSPTCLAIKVP